MARHILLRVPWHDKGWSGSVCSFPRENQSCLRLKKYPSWQSIHTQDMGLRRISTCFLLNLCFHHIHIRQDLTDGQ